MKMKQFAVVIALSLFLVYCQGAFDDDWQVIGSLPLSTENADIAHDGNGVSFLQVQSEAQYDWIKKKSLGEGSYGSVILAERKSDHQLAAIKRFQGDSAQESCEAELEALNAAVGQPHIMQLKLRPQEKMAHCAFEPGRPLKMPFYYFPVEYCDGGSVEGMIGDPARTISSSEVIEMALDALTGLKELSSLGFIHADIKPGNILRCGRVYKLGDLGTAKRVVQSPGNPKILWGADGKPIGLRGTPLYIAPEVYMHSTFAKPVSSADIFSMGLTLLHAVSGSKNGYLHGSLVDIIGAFSAGFPRHPTAEVVRNMIRSMSKERPIHPNLRARFLDETDRVGEGMLSLIGKMLAHCPQDRITPIAAIQLLTPLKAANYGVDDSLYVLKSDMLRPDPKVVLTLKPKTSGSSMFDDDEDVCDMGLIPDEQPEELSPFDQSDVEATERLSDLDDTELFASPLGQEQPKAVREEDYAFGDEPTEPEKELAPSEQEDIFEKYGGGDKDKSEYPSSLEQQLSEADFPVHEMSPSDLEESDGYDDAFFAEPKPVIKEPEPYRQPEPPKANDRSRYLLSIEPESPPVREVPNLKSRFPPIHSRQQPSRLSPLPSLEDFGPVVKKIELLPRQGLASRQNLRSGVRPGQPLNPVIPRPPPFQASKGRPSPAFDRPSSRIVRPVVNQQSKPYQQGKPSPQLPAVVGRGLLPPIRQPRYD